MKTPIVDDKSPRWRQTLLTLTRTMLVETPRRCMCIPSREDAKEEAARINPIDALRYE